MPDAPLPLLALAGGAGSGKSTIADNLADQMSAADVVHLDDCYHTDPGLAPSVPMFDGTGRIVDLSDPDSIDPDRVETELNRRAHARLLIVEGIFALTLPYVRDRARWTVYVDTPADIRISRKTLRKITEGRNPSHVLRGYLERGRDAHQRHVAPTRADADLILDGTQPIHDQVQLLRRLIKSGLS